MHCVRPLCQLLHTHHIPPKLQAVRQPAHCWRTLYLCHVVGAVQHQRSGKILTVVLAGTLSVPAMLWHFMLMPVPVLVPMPMPMRIVCVCVMRMAVT